jgi:hypothetical protein
MKYLGIFMDQKFKFEEHKKYAATRRAKLMHSLSKAAKMTIAILPLLTYGAQIRIEAIKHEHDSSTSVGDSKCLPSFSRV